MHSNKTMEWVMWAIEHADKIFITAAAVVLLVVFLFTMLRDK